MYTICLDSLLPRRKHSIKPIVDHECNRIGLLLCGNHVRSRTRQVDHFTRICMLRTDLNEGEPRVQRLGNHARDGTPARILGANHKIGRQVEFVSHGYNLLQKIPAKRRGFFYQSRMAQ